MPGPVVQEGLEEVVVVAVDQGDVDLGVAQPPHHREPAEAGAHHHDPGPSPSLPGAHPPTIPAGSARSVPGSRTGSRPGRSRSATSRPR